METQLSTITKQLQHVGIPVSSIVVSEAFYVRLGFEKVMQSTFEIDGEKGVCIMMKNGDVTIELYQMPEKHIHEIKNRNHGHIDHIAFDVNDIDKSFSMLKEASFHIIEDEPVHLPLFWSNGCRYFNILGPDGEKLEFNQVL